MESDLVHIRTGGMFATGTFEDQEPVQFEERHLIFLQQLGKVVHFKCFSIILQSFTFSKKVRGFQCVHKSGAL